MSEEYIRPDVYEIRRIIRKFVEPDDLIDPILVEAIINVESSQNPLAIRLEQKFFEKYALRLDPTVIFLYNDRLTYREQIEAYKVFLSCSWGLMQVMGLVAHEDGYRGNVRHLLTPEIGIQWGIVHLRKLSKRLNYKVEDVISAYNDGDHYRDRDNPQYVNKVMKEWAKLKRGQK